MIFKSIAHSWARSKLEKEEAHTHALIRELDRKKEAANLRIQAERSEYASKIEAHQEKRDKELKTYIDFMNEQLKTTAGYLPELKQLQGLMLTCVDSWMHVDLCQQEIDVVTQKRNTVNTTISLINAYINELNILSQRQGRRAWSEFTSARKLSVSSDFVEKTMDRIVRTSKNGDHEVLNEIRRLISQRNALYTEINALQVERAASFERKKATYQDHQSNKNVLAEKFMSCVEHWSQIARKFEAMYAFEQCELKYVNEWLGKLKEGGTLPEIVSVIGTAHEKVNYADEAFYDLNEEYQPYKRRVYEARESNEYPDTYSNDNTQRKRLLPMVKAAFEDKQALHDALRFLYARRDELNGYIDRIVPLHPEAAINAMCVMLKSDSALNTFSAFGILTRVQKREHWEMKQKRIDNASAN